MQISFQGELGSYSHQACSEAFPDAVPLPCSTFETAMDQVKEGNSEYAIIPVENSTYGRVADAYYLLPNSGLFIIKENITALGIVGISITSIGLFIIALAKAALCFSPPDNFQGK